MRFCSPVSQNPCVLQWLCDVGSKLSQNVMSALIYLRSGPSNVDKLRLSHQHKQGTEQFKGFEGWRKRAYKQLHPLAAVVMAGKKWLSSASPFPSTQNHAPTPKLPIIIITNNNNKPPKHPESIFSHLTLALYLRNIQEERAMFLQETLASATASIKARKATGREEMKLSHRKAAHRLKRCSPLPFPEFVSSDSVPYGSTTLQTVRQVCRGAKKKRFLIAVSGCHSSASPTVRSC